MNDNFTHLDSQGNVTMVDVGAKNHSERVAIAEAVVELAPATMELLRKNALPKGDVLTCAKIGGIMAAKRVGDLIPLCHPLPLSHCSVVFTLEHDAIRAECVAKTVDRTGVEMEALTGVSVALLTVYDMCKSMDKGMEITAIRLLEKKGGKSGDYART